MDNCRGGVSQPKCYQSNLGPSQGNWELCSTFHSQKMFSRSLQSPHLHYCGYNYVIVGYIMIIKQIRDELNAFDNWRLSSRQNHMGTWETLEIIKEMSRLKNSDVLVCSRISVTVTAKIFSYRVSQKPVSGFLTLISQVLEHRQRNF